MAQTANTYQPAGPIHTGDAALDVWASDFDRWLSTPAGARWLDEQEERQSMERAAMWYGDRPGLAEAA